MINIAFDIDGVCIDSHKYICNFIKEMYNGLDLTNMTSYVYKGISKKDLDMIIKNMYFDYDKVHIFTGVKKIFDELAKKDIKYFQFITYRPFDYAGLTYRLIKRFCKHPFQVAFLEANTPKYLFMNEYDAIVEDRRKYALEIANYGKHVYLIDYPYNQMDDHPNITRIKSFKWMITQI